MAILKLLLPFFGSIISERIKTKSTIDGAAMVATSALTAAAVATESSGMALDPSSVESYVVSIVIAVFGLYRIWNKGKPLKVKSK